MIDAVKVMTESVTPRLVARVSGETIAAPFVRATLDLAVAKGGDRRELLNLSGIDGEALGDPNARIAVAAWVALIRAAKDAAHDAAFALHFGEAYDLGDMSVVGLMGRAVETKGEGLRMVNRFCRLVADLETEGDERLRVVRERGETWMVDTRLNPNDTPEISEVAFAQMATMGRRMLPGMQHFRAVHFTHAEPPYRAEYERIFQVPIVFGSDRNAFLMPEGWEEDRIALQPRYALEILGAHAEALLERLDNAASMRSRVEEALAADLANGQASAGAVAARLGITTQTLYRRLKAEGTTFHQVVDALRHKLATHYLREKRMSAKETAYRLGFSDPAAFSRAFKRWTGSSPQEFQRSV
ncbi:MAG: AraC family transcriptional regulator [Pseudomonadota bacterium]|nr:AraC family transcriptional regulator [Pseudomonadota bacterium]